MQAAPACGLGRLRRCRGTHAYPFSVGVWVGVRVMACNTATRATMAVGVSSVLHALATRESEGHFTRRRVRCSLSRFVFVHAGLQADVCEGERKWERERSECVPADGKRWHISRCASDVFASATTLVGVARAYSSCGHARVRAGCDVYSRLVRWPYRVRWAGLLARIRRERGALLLGLARVHERAAAGTLRARLPCTQAWPAQLLPTNGGRIAAENKGTWQFWYSSLQIPRAALPTTLHTTLHTTLSSGCRADRWNPRCGCVHRRLLAAIVDGPSGSMSCSQEDNPEACPLTWSRFPPLPCVHISRFPARRFAVRSCKLRLGRVSWNRFSTAAFYA